MCLYQELSGDGSASGRDPWWALVIPRTQQMVVAAWEGLVVVF